MTPFFPNTLIAIAFVALVTLFLGIAAWVDVRTVRIPKAISVAMLACGLVMGLVRGAWLGSQGHTVWLLEPSPVLGGLDGLLFAAAGVLVGFAFFFVFWVLGIAGGGDVKLGAALGAWFGPLYIIGVILATFPVVIVLFVIMVVWRGIVPKPGQVRKRKIPMGFALPLMISTVALMIWGFRVELGLNVFL